MKTVLASASPRRKELLKTLLPEFEILPAKGEEKADERFPDSFVTTLACNKAREVKRARRDKTVIGADTVVVLDGKILGKPKSEEEAYEMLTALSGKTHQVLTGVCVITEDGREVSFCEKTEVEFFALSDGFIKSYIATGSPMDKAGAYGIQDGGLVKKIDGSFYNVVGLPVERLKETFEKLGIKE